MQRRSLILIAAYYTFFVRGTKSVRTNMRVVSCKPVWKASSPREKCLGQHLADTATRFDETKVAPSQFGSMHQPQRPLRLVIKTTSANVKPEADLLA